MMTEYVVPEICWRTDIHTQTSMFATTLRFRTGAARPTTTIMT